MIIMKTKHIKNQSALVMASALFIGSASFLTAQEVTIGGDAIEGDPGNALTGDMIVEGDATVNGSLFVQPDSAPVAPVDSVSATGTAGVPLSIQDNGDGTSTVSTRISTVDVDRVSNTAGGVQLDANGNVTLTPEETTTSQLRYGIFSQFNVDNATNTADPPTYVAGIVDEDGNLVSILAGVAVDTADSDSLNWRIDLDDPSLNVNDILIDSQVTTNDGNLTVGGNAEIAGSLKVDGVDVATVTDIDDAFDAQALVDAAQDQEIAKIATEIADRTALIRREADGLIHIGDNSMIYDDTQAGSDRLTSSKSLLILGGGATTDIQVDANLEVLGDATFRQNVFVDGDIFVGGRAQGLQAQTDANTAAIANNRRDIEKNRRGIAMVAAMTQSTVLPGMTHALDANVAHFEGKTGMAVSYSRRINENVQLNLAGASTTDFKESVIRGGIGVQW